MPQARDARELFEEQVPRVLAQHTERAREVDAVFCFKITGEGGGEWTVDLTSDPPSCRAGDSGSAQCTLEVAHEDFKTMFTDPQAGTALLFANRLKVTGDASVVRRIREFFELANGVVPSEG